MWIGNNEDVEEHLHSIGVAVDQIPRIPVELNKKIEIDLSAVYSGTQLRRILQDVGVEVDEYYGLRLQ